MDRNGHATLYIVNVLRTAQEPSLDTRTEFAEVGSGTIPWLETTKVKCQFAG